MPNPFLLQVFFGWGCPCGVIDKTLDRGIVVSDSNSSRAIAFTFGQMPLRKVRTPLFSKLWVN